MPKISSFVLSTDREVKAAKSRRDRAEFRIKDAKNLVLRTEPFSMSSARCSLSMVMVAVRFWLVDENPNQTAIRTMTAPREAVDNGDMGRDAPYPGAVDGSGYGGP